MRRIERNNTGLLNPGQDLVVAGYAGLAGTLEIIRRKEQELRQWFSEDYLSRILEQNPAVLHKDLEQWKRYGATECEPAGQGGIFKALWDLSGAYMRGIRFSLKKIPVKQETIEICERYDLNPYRLLSTGSFLLTAQNGGDLVYELKSRGIDAVVIGKVTGDIKRLIDHGDTVGFLDRPTEDELKKIII